MRNIKFPKCPICLQEIKSDATLTNYCRLCGMAIDGSNKRFCCKICESKLRAISKNKKSESNGKNN